MAFYQGYAPGMPGIGPSSYARGRQIWAGLAGIQYLPVGGIIASALARDPDNFEPALNYGNETEPGTPPTSADLSNIPQVPGAFNGAAPTGTVPGYSGILRAGLLMGRISGTSTVPLSGSTKVGGFFRPSIIGLTTATTGTGAASLTVTAQCANEIGRQMGLGITSFALIGTTAAGTALGVSSTGTITAITNPGTTNTTATVITATVGTVGSGPLPIGSFVVPNDGSQFPVTFIDEQFGLNVVDGMGNAVSGNSPSSNSFAIAPFPRVPIAGGMVNVLNLVNYPSTANTGYAVLRAWIKSNLNSGGANQYGITNYGGKFNFTDDYGL